VPARAVVVVYYDVIVHLPAQAGVALVELHDVSHAVSLRYYQPREGRLARLKRTYYSGVAAIWLASTGALMWAHHLRGHLLGITGAAPGRLGSLFVVHGFLL
jgi:hypothetical protein